MCLGEKLERKEKGFAQKTGQNLLFWGKNKGFGSLNSLIQTLQLSTAFEWLLAMPGDHTSTAGHPY